MEWSFYKHVFGSRTCQNRNDCQQRYYKDVLDISNVYACLICSLSKQCSLVCSCVEDGGQSFFEDGGQSCVEDGGQ